MDSYWHYRGFLPHYETDEKIQSITIRLADSLPAHAVERLLTDTGRLENDTEYRVRLEAFLDSGYGSCLLANPVYAGALQDSLIRCDGTRYELHAWTIMPNHAHILVHFKNGYKMGSEIKAWKAQVSRLVEDRKKGRGSVWQEDYWDRWIRDENHYGNTVNYINNNPVKAGLVKCDSTWAWGSCGSGWKKNDTCA